MYKFVCALYFKYNMVLTVLTIYPSELNGALACVRVWSVYTDAIVLTGLDFTLIDVYKYILSDMYVCLSLCHELMISLLVKPTYLPKSHTSPEKPGSQSQANPVVLSTHRP